MQPRINLVELDKNNREHLDIMFTVRSHPEVDRYLRGSPPPNFATHINYVQNLNPSKRFLLVQVNSYLSGYCQLTINENQVEIGMALHPNFCSKGVGTIAMSLLLSYLQKNEELKHKPLILFVKKDNIRAISLYTKYGFKHTGIENEYEEYLMQKINSLTT